jgi:hypothetical protein
MAWSASNEAGFDLGSAEAVCCSIRNVRRMRALKDSRLNLRRPWIEDRSDSKESGRYAYIRDARNYVTLTMLSCSSASVACSLRSSKSIALARDFVLVA